MQWYQWGIEPLYVWEDTMSKRLCIECNVETINLEYCNVCAAHMGSNTLNKETSMKAAKSRLHAEANALIAKLYGEDAVLRNELMFNERNAGSIAYEATKCGTNMSEVLTRTEIEDLSIGVLPALDGDICKARERRADKEYEQTPHDLIDYGVSNAKQYTTAQIRDFMSGRETVELSEEVEEALRDEVKKVFIPQIQKETNFSFYINRVKEAKTPGQVGWIGKMVFDAIKGSERTFMVLKDGEEVEITGATFFPSLTDVQKEAGELSYYKRFWAFYKKAKESKAAESSNTLELNYNKVLTIVNKATENTPEDNLMDVISYEISLLDQQSLWDSLKYAKQNGCKFAYPVFSAILAYAKADRSA